MNILISDNNSAVSGGTEENGATNQINNNVSTSLAGQRGGGIPAGNGILLSNFIQQNSGGGQTVSSALSEQAGVPFGIFIFVV